MTSNHNYDYFNGGCHGMAANGQGYAQCGLQGTKVELTTKVK